MGVWAGLSKITGTKVILLRLSAMVWLLFYPVTAILIYALLAVFLRDRNFIESESDAGADMPQTAQLMAVQSEYAELQERLAALESDALSRETELRQRFKEAGFT